MAAGAVVLFTLLAAGFSRRPAPSDLGETGNPLLSRMLRFEDRADGGVAVFDAANGNRIDVLAPGTNGFLRATVRGLAGKRIRQSLVNDTVKPFRLTAWSSNRLTLDDTATGQRIDLEAFGASNVAAFGHLLTVKETPP